MFTKRILQILKLNQFGDIEILYFKKITTQYTNLFGDTYAVVFTDDKNYRGDYHNYRQKHVENIECHLYF